MPVGDQEPSYVNHYESAGPMSVWSVRLQIRLGRAVLEGVLPCDEVVPLTTVSRAVGPDPRSLRNHWGFRGGSSPGSFTYPMPADPAVVDTIGAGTAYRTAWMRRSDGVLVRERRPGVIFSYDRARQILDRMMATYSD